MGVLLFLDDGNAGVICCQRVNLYILAQKKATVLSFRSTACDDRNSARYGHHPHTKRHDEHSGKRRDTRAYPVARSGKNDGESWEAPVSGRNGGLRVATEWKKVKTKWLSSAMWVSEFVCNGMGLRIAIEWKKIKTKWVSFYSVSVWLQPLTQPKLANLAKIFTHKRPETANLITLQNINIL